MASEKVTVEQAVQKLSE
ncbi:unnamed protein product, partial [Rotaria sp. Silwood1]